MSAISTSDVNQNTAEAEQARESEVWRHKTPRQKPTYGHDRVPEIGFTPAVLTAIIPELRGFSWLGGESWPVKVRVL